LAVGIGFTTNSTVIASGSRPASAAACRLRGRGEREHHVGVLPRERLAAAGRAGLDHHRLLVRRQRVQRSPDAEVAALVVDGVDLREVGVDAVRGVLDDGARLPAAPELPHDVDPLVGAVVAEVVLRLLVEAVVPGCEVGTGGDHVEAESPVREVLQRREQAGRGVRLPEARRDGRHDADPLRRAEQVRHERERVVLRHEPGRREVHLGRAAVGVGHGDAVLDDQQVEPRALERADRVLVDRGLLPVVPDAVGRVAPALHAEAGAEEPAEVDRHRASSVR
jgi:hypothetical protein